MENIIGREKEIKRLDRAMEENEAQLIIVYGRRRVGKTFLINEYFNGKFDFKFTGAFDQSTKEQLKNFKLELKRYAVKEIVDIKDWTEAFFALRDCLEESDKKEKQVVFFDEMPWMDRQKSGFLPAFEWFWNSWGSARKNLVFIVCGSAASWMTEKIDKNKGGLFNRHTCRLYLEPFDLHDTEKYLESRNIYWSRYDITLCYMIMGGIPYYLRLLDRESTLNENIDKLFFNKRSELWNEFSLLYHTLFSNSEPYIRIVEELSKKRSGLKREEIVNNTGLPSNGVLSKMLLNLENSGFICISEAFGGKKTERRYRLCDYYTLFYFRFIKNNYGKDEQYWSNMTDNPAKNAWTGLTFEHVCFDHINQIKHTLEIAGVKADVSSWQIKGTENEPGAQIDMVIDRRDKVINLCEIKFSGSEFEIDKDYDLQLKNKVAAFMKDTKTKCTIQLTLITTYGLVRNKYSNYVSKEVCLENLFE